MALPDEPENRFIERLVARDPHAFSELVRVYEQRVFGLLLRMLGHEAEARELAQEVFLQVFKAIGSFRGDSKLSTWIYRIAINLSKNRNKYLRARHAKTQEDFDAIAENATFESTSQGDVSAARPDELAIARQLEKIVQESILALDPAFRECLVLCDVEELSYDEISEITGLPSGTVKSRIHRARAQLRELVESKLGEKLR